MFNNLINIYNLVPIFRFFKKKKAINIDHSLKIWSEFFNEIRNNNKKFELRKILDRKFQLGQTLLLREYCPISERYSGRYEAVKVDYILTGPYFDLPADLAIMSISRLGLDESNSDYNDNAETLTDRCVFAKSKK